MSGLARLALDTLSGSGPGGPLTVMILHRVHAAPDPLFPDEPDRERFAGLLQRLKRWFNILPLPEALDRLVRRSLPRRALSITFDDGYADNCTVALPILERLGVKATFFVAAGYLDGGRMFNDTVIEAVRRFEGKVLDLSRLGLGLHRTTSLAERREAIDALIAAIKYLEPGEREERALAIARAAEVAPAAGPMLTCDQLRGLHRSGMHIGGHTLGHPILTKLSDSEARAEIASGKERLEALLGERIRLFAYPNGKPGRDYGPEHVCMVRELGFDAAFSTAPGAARAGDDLYQLPRFSPWARAPWRQFLQLFGNLRRRDFPGAAT
jgi:peptidoglycan/xylan/chitin deacetylase (PgdA/CDA1 family)